MKNKFLFLCFVLCHFVPSPVRPLTAPIPCTCASTGLPHKKYRTETQIGLRQETERTGGASNHQTVATIPTSYLLVSDHGDEAIYKYELGAHAKRTCFAGVPTPYGIVADRDGSLLVATGENGGSILRLHGRTGKILGTFIPAGKGGLTIPYGIAFGPDGNLYIINVDTGILRYNGITGEFIDKFIPGNSGGIGKPSGIAFGRDGNLYLGDFDSANIYRYNGATGAFLGVFASYEELKHTRNLTFGPDGNLYACCGFFDATNTIFRFNGATGDYINDFIANGSGGLGTPSDLTFGADGKLYVVGEGDHRVLSYNGASGKFLTSVGTTESNGAGILYRAGNVFVSGKVVREGQEQAAKTQWLTFTLHEHNMPTIKVTQMVFPDGTFTLSLPPYKGSLTVEGDRLAAQPIPLDTTEGDVTHVLVTLKPQPNLSDYLTD